MPLNLGCLDMIKSTKKFKKIQIRFHIVVLVLYVFALLIRSYWPHIQPMIGILILPFSKLLFFQILPNACMFARVLAFVARSLAFFLQCLTNVEKKCSSQNSGIINYMILSLESADLEDRFISYQIRSLHKYSALYNL